MPIQTFILKNRVKATMLFVFFLTALLLLPATVQVASGLTPGELCTKELNVNKNDPKVDACVRGYGFASANKKITACDNTYKKSKNLAKACKTGFNLKKNAKPNNPNTTANLSSISAAGLPDSEANQNTVEDILRVIFGIIGAFALLNITLSGFKYITAAGNEQKVSEAKNGIVYSLLGLMIAIAAQAIVSFVVHRISP